MAKRKNPDKCAVCGKLISDDAPKKFNVDTSGLEKIGVTPPKSGYHWVDWSPSAPYLKKLKMYPVCTDCYKLIEAPEKRSRIIKARIATAKK